jgi:programmed cell death protein 5
MSDADLEEVCRSPSITVIKMPTTSRSAAPVWPNSNNNQAPAPTPKTLSNSNKKSKKHYPPSQIAPHFIPPTNPRPQFLLPASDREAEDSARQSILNQILSPEAADRLGRIRLVRASRAQDVENRLIQLARQGQIRQKVGEEELKGFLEKVAETEQGGKEQKIAVVRRGGGWDDDDDDLEALLDD